MFGRNLVDRRDDFGGLNGVGPDLVIVLGGSSRGCVLWSTGFAAGGAGDVVVGRSLHTHTHCGSAVLGFNDQGAAAAGGAGDVAGGRSLHTHTLRLYSFSCPAIPPKTRSCCGGAGCGGGPGRPGSCERGGCCGGRCRDVL